MKHKLFALLLCLLAVPIALPAQTSFVNLTPKPKLMTVNAGTLALPADFVVSYDEADEAMLAEMNRFVATYNAATGAQVTVARNQADALFTIEAYPAGALQKAGAYAVVVTADKVTLRANDALSLFYAFQTVKKMLPANVMAGVFDPAVKAYELPLVSINDEPRFEYRGFMLDVSRHFFTVEDVKRMIDLMAYYKMNRFHWHLSDDQGWRVEIKKYPKLTTVGSIAPNCMFTDMYSCTQYWINKPYGPYFYTQDELRDVVAYARERHIEIVPEIDMPGHFVAAMASYPEYSCYPNGSHTVWSTGGISSDILNVANPEAVQFAKDILEELMDIFPYETIHIGGDECPTTAWENNADCQARYEELGLTNYRQLQSHFIKEMADFVQSKGRKLAVWNEAITAGNADTETVKSTDALVYCWTRPEAAAKKAAELGLKNIYTPWGPYYINRKQGNSPQDPPGAGYGTDDVRATYNQAIPSETDYGVQGTFWTEHVSDRDYMEWLALPRLIAIAEAGWTPQTQRSFTDFQQRMTADTVLLNYGNYKYCKYHMLVDTEEPGMVMPKVNTAEKKYYYRLVTGATDARKDRCIELVAEGSELLNTYASNNITVGRLWTNTLAASDAANYDSQWWSLEEDPASPGKYALVCKAQPEGSVKPNPTAESNAGRWDYDPAAKHYNFELGTAAYGTKGDNYFYSIASDQLSGKYLNASLGGQGMSVNVYGNPNDGNSGRWEFVPAEDYSGGSTTDPVTLEPLVLDATYTFTNSVEGFDQTALADNSKGEKLTHSTDPFAANAWRVAASTFDEATGVQTLQLQNVTTGRTVSGSTAFIDREGCPVTVGTAAADLQLSYEPLTHDYRLRIGGKSLFPMPSGNVHAGTTIKDATYDAPRLQGAMWQVQRVKVLTLHCVDEAGNDLATCQRSVPFDLAEPTADYCPAIANHAIESIAPAEEGVYTVTYRRTAFAVTLRLVDQRGAIISDDVRTVPVGETYKVEIPEVPYYTFSSSSVADATVLTPEADMQLEAVYTTDAYAGVKGKAELVTADLQAGQSYLLYDNSDANAGARKGYRLIVPDTKNINRSTTDTDLLPNATWTLVASDGKFKVKNEYMGLYVPELQRSGAAVASKAGGVFAFNLNPDGESWNVKGSNGQYWDGNEAGALVGWDGGTGHPILVYRYYVQPYFGVRVLCKDNDGNVLSETAELLKAGSPYSLVIPEIEGKYLWEVKGNENFQGVVDSHLTIEVTYGNVPVGIGQLPAAGTSRQAIFDLSGRRLQRVPQAGLYIINGQKVLVK